MKRGAEHIDHTADLAFALWAEDEADLLRVGAEAIVAVITEDAKLSTGQAERVLTLRTLDPEDRLVQWLNEVIVWAVVDGFLVTAVDFRLRPNGLDATVRGIEEAWDLVRGELKAATYHDLKLVFDPSGVRAQVVIDV